MAPTLIGPTGPPNGWYQTYHVWATLDICLVVTRWPLAADALARGHEIPVPWRP